MGGWGGDAGDISETLVRYHLFLEATEHDVTDRIGIDLVGAALLGAEWEERG
jgi:hypothetical protein